MTNRNPSKWSVHIVVVAGKRTYQVYRLLDQDRINCKENMETRGGYWETRYEAEKLAENLNKSNK